MALLLVLLIILGLAVFETINSVDNVIINAHILATMQPRSRKWFMSWGILLSVFVVRGMLPLLLLWAAAPSSGMVGVLVAGLNPSSTALQTIRESAGMLLSASGVFLISIFLHWLLLEEREYEHVFRTARMTRKLALYAALLVLVASVVFFSRSGDPRIALGAFAGAAVSVIIFKMRDVAETEEKILARGKKYKDVGKIAYLEIIDASFSFDGVLGAFAFTFSIPLILLGNGLGAIIVRYFTINNMEQVRRYRYLKDGAMYSIFFLGAVMAADSLGITVPEVLPPLATFGLVGYFLYRSLKS